MRAVVLKLRQVLGITPADPLGHGLGRMDWDHEHKSGCSPFDKNAQAVVDMSSSSESRTKVEIFFARYARLAGTHSERLLAGAYYGTLRPPSDAQF